jgi:hypothetical protein
VIDGEPGWIQPDGTMLPVPPNAVQPGTVVPPAAPGSANPPAAPKAEEPVIPPKPPEPGLLEDNLDDELFDVPAPPPESSRRKKPSPSKIQHAAHEAIRGQTPDEVIFLRPTVPKPTSKATRLAKKSVKKAGA